ncbi:MAG: hypothetical protein IPJ65_24815 [Archangiaceae bacterium]|nr:hypothetical protein [Archangiaceae bacterium]
MAIRGKMYIVPNAAERTWRLVVKNEGDQQFAVTQNILPANDPTRDQHDDTARYGHGLMVSPSKVSTQSFRLGSPYLHYTIEEDSHLRLGLRGLAYQTVPLPPLDGPPVELDLQDFVWYGGSPDSSVAQAHNWAGSEEHRADVAEGEQLLAEVEQLMLMATHGIKCEGTAKLKAVEGPGGKLSHWELWFSNEGDQPFIGTVSFANGSKNDGLGLESMACPGNGQAAMQRIEALGNYGDEARPGAVVRLGVRGYSWKEVPLPASGEVELPLKSFKLAADSFSEEYFDPAKVEEKRAEKRDRVQFFDHGKPLNDALEPKTYFGAEALARSTYDPPSASVWSVGDAPDTPGGGWVVELENTLPQNDREGMLGVVATLSLGDAGWDPALLPPKRFDFPQQAKRWFIPHQSVVNGVTAVAGERLHLGTRGLGWSASVELPARGGKVRSQGDDQFWGFREDQYHRRKLAPAFTNKCRK